VTTDDVLKLGPIVRLDALELCWCTSARLRMPSPRANVSAVVTMGRGCMNTLIRRALCSWASVAANFKMFAASARPSMKTTISPNSAVPLPRLKGGRLR